jgi:hypothetical protein
MKATATATCKSFCEIFHKVQMLLVPGHKRPAIQISGLICFHSQFAGE